MVISFTLLCLQASFKVRLRMCVFVCVGAVCGQSDASAEVHLSLEESSPASTFCPAGLHEDAGESRTSAHLQAEGGLDRPLQVGVTLLWWG